MKPVMGCSDKITEESTYKKYVCTALSLTMFSVFVMNSSDISFSQQLYSDLLFDCAGMRMVEKWGEIPADVAPRISIT